MYFSEAHMLSARATIWVELLAVIQEPQYEKQ